MLISLSRDLEDQTSPARSVVEVAQDDLLPCSEKETPACEWDRERRPDPGGADMGISVPIRLPKPAAGIITPYFIACMFLLPEDRDGL